MLSLVIFSVANQCLDLTYQLFFISIWNLLLLELQCELYSYPLPHPSSSPYSQTALMFISGRLSFACWHFSSSSSGPHFHLCCSLLCSRPSLFPFLACWSSAANFTCWCDNTALWNLSLTHTHSHSLFSRYSRKLSVCAVSVQRVMMCRTALKMDQCLHCRTDAVIAPLYFQHHHPISDPFPFALDFL